MDIPAAAPAQSGNQSNPSDLLQQASTPLAWITFGGAPHESSAAFIQSIQRIAFQQNRLRDDKWITEYVSTCFDGDALFWYLELEEEIQESWKRLRLALARRFPSTPKPAETSTVPSTLSSSPAPALSGISILNAGGKRGRIEVLGDLASPLGYLAFDPASGIFITPFEDKAVIITRPNPISLERSSDPYQIQMMGLSGPSAAFPFLGLALLKGQTEDCAVPKEIARASFHRPESGWYNVPVPSPVCKTKVPGPILSSSARPQLATWIWSNCGRSRSSLAWLRKSATQAPNTKAAAAIWKYGSRTDDLYLSWLMDDQVERELGAYVHSSTNGSLHVHRPQDVDAAGEWLDEVRVQLVFKEIS